MESAVTEIMNFNDLNDFLKSVCSDDVILSDIFHYVNSKGWCHIKHGDLWIDVDQRGPHFYKVSIY